MTRHSGTPDPGDPRPPAPFPGEAVPPGPAWPLAGVRVVDLTSNVAAPFGSAVLADLGAQVAKVEPPHGDDVRRMAPLLGDGSAYFHVVTRNKTCVRLDLRAPADRARLDALLDAADVFVTNLRPAVLAGLGLDPASVRADRPRLVVAALTAYGAGGPERDRPGYDAVLQARTGVAAVTGTADGPPVRAGVSILDVGGGTWLALGVLAALLRRERTGAGGEVTTSLFETGVSWGAYHVVAAQVSGRPSGRHGSGHPAFSPYGIFPTADGELCLGIGGDGLFRRLCAALGEPALAEEAPFATNALRCANDAALRDRLEGILAARGAAQWARVLQAADLPVDRVQRPEELLDDPQAQATGILLDLPVAVPAGAVPAGGGPPGDGVLRMPGLPLLFDGVRPPVRHPARDEAPPGP